jgi:pimeloyl-ACP methyl ester carboxylesterase
MAKTQAKMYWRTPKGVRRDYVDSRFGQVHYRIARPESPSAVPLMCFHPSPISGRLYGQLLAEMGRDRIAVAPDTPGFGESDAPLDAPEIADYAAAMGEVLDSLGLGEVDVMGYHTGSKICVELAQQRPRQVRRLVLVSAPINTEEELARHKADYGAKEISAEGSHLQARWDGHWKWRGPGTPLELVHREVVESLRGGTTSWWGHRASRNYQHAEYLPKVTQPVLVLCPKDDLWEATLRARDVIRNGRLLKLPDWGHGMLDMHAKEVSTILRDFLDAPAVDVAPSSQVPKAPPKAPLRSERAGHVRRRFIDGAHGQLHLHITEGGQGRNTPLVCLHMSPNSGRIWSALIEEIGRDRIAVAPDMPGLGESDAPQTAPEIEDYARAVTGLIETLGLGAVDVMGYHTGSITCAELALQRPDLVRRIVMVSAPIFTDEELMWFRENYAATPLKEDGSHIVERWQNMIGFYSPQVPAEVLYRNFADSLRGGPVSWWGHRAAFNYPLGKRLPDVSHPILLINPNDDLVEQTPRAVPLMQNGRIHDIPEMGHGFIDVMTPEIGALLREFLDA